MRDLNKSINKKKIKSISYIKKFILIKNMTCINKKILHAYNNSCIPQMGICKVTIINKGTVY